MTKITKFKKNNETSERIIKHAKLQQQNPSDDTKKENKTEEEKKEENKNDEEEEEEIDESHFKYSRITVGSFVYLAESQRYALVKSKIEEKENLYECKISQRQNQEEEIKEIYLYEHGKEGTDAVRWTAKVYVNVRVVLTENKT